MTTNIKQKQLKLLLNDFEMLSKTALTQFQITSKLFQDNTLDVLYEEAEANEVIMDRLEIKVREEVVFTILQFSPIATDLRKIITYQDVTTNLERIGDMLLNIIHFLKKTELTGEGFAELRKLLAEMIENVHEMLRNTIAAFLNEDSALAYKTIKDDDIVDELFHSIRQNIQVLFAGRNLAANEIKNMITISSISHNLERIGDSATNIAEAAIYLTEGKDIRHGNEK